MAKRSAAGKNTSVALGLHFEKFIGKQVKSGRYGTRSEVVRAGLRLLEEHQARLGALQTALEHGEQSGVSADYSLEWVLGEVDRTQG